MYGVVSGLLRLRMDRVFAADNRGDRYHWGDLEERIGEHGSSDVEQQSVQGGYAPRLGRVRRCPCEEDVLASIGPVEGVADLVSGPF